MRKILASIQALGWVRQAKFLILVSIAFPVILLPLTSGYSPRLGLLGSLPDMYIETFAYPVAFTSVESEAPDSYAMKHILSEGGSVKKKTLHALNEWEDAPVKGEKPKPRVWEDAPEMPSGSVKKKTLHALNEGGGVDLSTGEVTVYEISIPGTGHYTIRYDVIVALSLLGLFIGFGMLWIGNHKEE